MYPIYFFALLFSYIKKCMYQIQILFRYNSSHTILGLLFVLYVTPFILYSVFGQARFLPGPPPRARRCAAVNAAPVRDGLPHAVAPDDAGESEVAGTVQPDPV